jgi:hypothetical protein
MVGRAFEVVEKVVASSVTLNPGDVVTVVAWDNSKDVASVTTAAGATVDVPKRALRPKRTAVAGVAPYSAGVGGQATAVASAEQKLTSWNAKQAQYSTPKQQHEFAVEQTRLQDVVRKKNEVLNRKLIQETMFNRFDASIRREVDAANSAHSLKGAAALDPNVLKAMLFQESQLGTSGQHLEQPPSHPVKSRFNLGQVIDSSGMALLTMLEKEQATLLSTTIPDIRKDLVAAQQELHQLQNKTSRTPAEESRLGVLKAVSAQNWETFIWSYKAPPHSFGAVVKSFFASASPAKDVDYNFWIHMAVMWLFEKHKPGQSWSDTIRAYNGSGKRAEHYRDAVTRRASDAAAAELAKKDFVPSGI